MSVEEKVISVESEAEFKGYIESDKVTVVDFYAVWCGPCKVISPVLEKLANDSEFAELNFIKVDVDKLDNVSAEMGIRAMPTFMVFKGGEKVNELVGANPGALKAMVTKVAQQ
ncbi:hypothetical protein H072_6019 [Dactylellina haptotyla CBS 200.50]|uniref:Thioredoxin n=1 Tax=Dactylellina haptotyla (strain CBS 200.50) TaxID=1284197 RepID=S8AGE5_DACHA|nr:hypothetical protein H072_6019 [Dactylellina haptotyla CBS 200.50]